jgi:hypothetical protein
LHAILAERQGITPEMALRIGKFAGNGPDLKRPRADVVRLAVARYLEEYEDLWCTIRRFQDPSGTALGLG